MPNLQELQQQLEQFESFMQTSAYRALQATLQLDLEATESNIIGTLPDKPEDLAYLNRLHGQRLQLLNDGKLFDDACDRLRTEIDKLVEAKNIVVKPEEPTIDEN